MGSVATTVRRDGPQVLLLVVLTMLAVQVSTDATAGSLCSLPELPPGAYLTEIVGDKAFYRCGNHKLVALCVEGNWLLPVANCLKAAMHRLTDASSGPRRITGVYSLVSRRRRARSGRRRGSRNGPHIALDSPPLVVVRAGEDASMMCRVENLGSHSITWTRVSDNTVIAIDTNVLVGDPRVTAKFEESLGSILQVGRTRVDDQAEYECQVSTRPPLRHLVDLQVLPQGEELLLPSEPSHNTDPYDFLQRNLSALWKEVGLLRNEIQHHLHAGSTDHEYNRALDEIEVMHHENAVHNHHRPHYNHNLHHNADILQHMVTEHGHHHTHKDEGEGHREHNHHHDHQQDIHDHHGLHEHEHDHDDFNSHEDLGAYNNFENDDHHATHAHDDNRLGSHGHGGLLIARVNQETSEDNDDHEESGSRTSNMQNSHGSRVQSNRQQNSHGHEGHNHGHGVHQGRDDGMMVAYCDLQPNKDMPTSNVRGSITISQRKDRKGPVYFDLDLEGFDVQRDGYLHGFHIHAQQVTQDNKCGAAKGHFNPFNVHHGGPTSQTRHVGDLGNIRVDEDGELEGYILSDNIVAFVGENKIVGKSIVVHAGEDDLGLGGAPDSLTTGAAGGRLACCNIKIMPQARFRIKG